MIRMTPDQLRDALGSKGASSKGSPQPTQQPAPSKQTLAQGRAQKPLLWVVMGLLLGFALSGLGVGTLRERVTDVEALTKSLDTQAQAIAEWGIEESATLARVEQDLVEQRALLQDLASPEVSVGAGPAYARSVDVPNEPEAATRALATALRELGATATCPGECLVYVDRLGNVTHFVFNP